MVIRNSAGAIVEVIDTELNFGSIDVAGVDYGINYHRHIGSGVASVSLNVTQSYRYMQALVPGSAAVEAVSAAQDNGDWAPRWKGAFGTGWTEGLMSAYLDGRYTSSYEDYDSNRLIGNFWIFDTNWRWGIGKWLTRDGNWLHDSYLEAGANNIFNRGPQFSNFGFDFMGFDAAQANVVGRSLYVHIGIQW